MRTLRYVVADVFTDRALAGNPVAVFTNALGLEPAQMQALARELNLSETVFVLPREGAGQARIRIFTPTRELPFAGHPTLGTAFVLGSMTQRDELTLETAQGPVAVRLERDAAKVRFGWMNQPLPSVLPFDDEAALLAALGVQRSEAPIAAYDNGIVHVFVALASRAAVAALRPDLARLAVVGDVAVNVLTGARNCWKTRMFAPSLGVAEDPATGSAAGPLAVHLARLGRIAWGDTIEIEQGAEIGRPSRLLARAEGAGERVRRVEVGGAAVVVARGEFHLVS
ncbi:MAG: PhzF family phenazine biosynthesis protein [Polyangiaceae bacterium]|nr:PhzF family phenazine biosynthesis protein [Polyangiaceae bacterium]